MRRHQISRLFSASSLCVRGYEPGSGAPGPLPPWILPEAASAARPRGQPRKGQAPRPAKPPSALQAQLLALQADAAAATAAAAAASPPSPPGSSTTLPLSLSFPLPPVRRGILTGFFRPVRVAWHPPLTLPQRGGGKKATTRAENSNEAEASTTLSPSPFLSLPAAPLSSSTSSSSDLFLLPPGWHPPLVLLDRRLLTPAALGIPKKHKRGGVGRWHPPLAWPPRVAAAAAAAAEFGKRVRIARYAPVSASAKCGRCKYCLFPEMRQACMVRRAEAERRRAEDEVALLEAEADAAEAEAAEAEEQRRRRQRQRREQAL